MVDVVDPTYEEQEKPELVGKSCTQFPSAPSSSASASPQAPAAEQPGVLKPLQIRQLAQRLQAERRQKMPGGHIGVRRAG